MKKSLSKLITRPLEVFLHTESSSGILLGFCALLAMILANSSFSTNYFEFLNTKILGLNIQHWINDGLMTIFFFVIGMEIKKELMVGELSSLKKATFPIAGALGGMLIPALIYFSLNTTPPNSNGWGIPMATDIAFAIGVLSLFGSRVPLSLKIFLLALAIVDDLGAILVIAFFYTKKIHVLGLGLAALAFAFMLLGKNRRIKSYMYYFILGVTAWFGFLYSGVHATIAGVIMGLLTPLQFEYGKNLISTYSPLEDLIHKLHPWVSFVIMPIFALANAGIALGNIDFFELIGNPIHQGVALGLLIGKPFGIFIFAFLAVNLKISSLPKGLRWEHIIGTGFLGGIGFTMALFISSLALSTSQELYSKTGIVLGSIVAAILGAAVLKFAFSRD